MAKTAKIWVAVSLVVVIIVLGALLIIRGLEDSSNNVGLQASGSDVAPAMAVSSSTDLIASVVYPASTTDIVASLPITIGEGLSVTQVGYYNGVFVDDGSMEIVYNVLAIILKNESGQALSTAKITMNMTDVQAVFNCNMLPDGESVMIIENTRLVYTGNVTDAELRLEHATFCEDENVLTLSDFEIYGENGMICVKNISGKDIRGDVTIHYKYEGSNGLLGGTDFHAVISGGLDAGAEKRVLSNSYLQSACKITMATQG